MDVYRSWSVSSTNEVCTNCPQRSDLGCLGCFYWQNSVIVSQQALEAWVFRHLVKDKDKSTGTTVCTSQEFPAPQTAVMSDILCKHNHLDSAKATNMKRISQVGLSLRPFVCYSSG